MALLRLHPGVYFSKFLALAAGTYPISGLRSADRGPNRHQPSSEHRLRLVTTEDEFAALEPCWDRLVDESAIRSPFMRWDWASLWWQECRGDAKLAIGVLEDRFGDVLAIAPLMIAAGDTGASQPMRQLTFLGGLGEAAGQRMDLIIPAGREGELGPEMCEAFSMLKPRWDRVLLNRLPEESPNREHILNALRRCSAGATVLNRHAVRFARLPASWLDYENQHTGEWRSKFRRKWKAMLREHGACHSLAGEEAPAGEVFDRLVSLHRIRWADGVSGFTTDASLRFHRRLMMKWIAEGRAAMPFIGIGGQIEAVIYGLIESGEFSQYQMGWNPEFARMSLGKLAMRWSIERSIALRLQRHDLLPGDFEYKREWGESERAVLDIEGFNEHSPRAGFFRVLRAAKRAVKPRREAAHA